MIFETIILKNILRRKTRSILTIVGIGVAMGAVVSLISMTRGFTTDFLATLEGKGTDLIIMKKSSTNMVLSSIDEKIITTLREIPGIKRIARVLVDIGEIEDKPMTMIIGFDPKEYLIETNTVLEGRRFLGGDAREIILGRIAEDNLEKKVGDIIEIHSQKFTVVGIVDGGSLIDNGAIMMDIKQLQKLVNREDQVMNFSLQLENKDMVGTVKVEIEKRIDIVTAISAKDLVASDEGLQLGATLSWIISAIAILAGVVMTMNTMIMAVFERTKEIGILRAMGWKKNRGLRMILGESLLLSFFGGISGVFVGLGLIKLITSWKMVRGFISPQIDSVLLIEIAIMAIVLGALAGLYPAYKATNISPMEAVRYE